MNVILFQYQRIHLLIQHFGFINGSHCPEVCGGSSTVYTLVHTWEQGNGFITPQNVTLHSNHDARWSFSLSLLQASFNLSSGLSSLHLCDCSTELCVTPLLWRCLYHYWVSLNEWAAHRWFLMLSWCTDLAGVHCSISNRVCQPGWLHRHMLSFTLESWAESFSCISILSLYLKWPP